MNRSLVFCLLVLTQLISGCQPDKVTIKSVLANSGCNQSFIDKRYCDVNPIAQIIDLPNFSSALQKFNIDSAGEFVQIYAVGEILYSLTDKEKKYYLMGDDIKLYFKTNQESVSDINYVFAYKDVKKFKKEGVDFKWNSENNNTKYVAEVKIPWTNISTNQINNGDSVDFNILVGDNDDGFIQSSEIGWMKSFEAKNSYGKIFLQRNQSIKAQRNRFVSHYGTPQIDGIVDVTWSRVPVIELKQVTRGYIKDCLDLSVTVRSQWDKKFLYFVFEINDSRQKHIPPKKEKERGIFVDFAWIENEKSEMVWQMNAKESKHAGGILKNQQIDTSFYLPKGEYVLHYITDESHAFNDWIGVPPTTSFYGIVVYKKF